MADAGWLHLLSFIHAAAVAQQWPCRSSPPRRPVPAVRWFRKGCLIAGALARTAAAVCIRTSRPLQLFTGAGSPFGEGQRWRERRTENPRGHRASVRSVMPMMAPLILVEVLADRLLR